MEANKQFIGILLLFIMLFSCKSSIKEKEQAGFSVISMSKEDQQILGIEYGSVIISTGERKKILKGELESSYTDINIVPVPLKGFLKKLYVKNGDHVNRGQLLAVLTHPDYIELQRQYLETKSDYDFLKTDYQRQGELGLEAATSLKIMQKAQSDFSKIEVKLMALKAKLIFIGIVADSLNIENISSEIQLYAPYSGEITQLESIPGIFLTEDKPLMQIATINEKWITIDSTNELNDPFYEGLNLTISTSQNKEKMVKMNVREENLKKEDGKIKLYFDKNSILMPDGGVSIEFDLKSDTMYSLPLSAIFTISGKMLLFKKVSENQIMAIQVDSINKNKLVNSLLKDHPEWKDDFFIIRGVEKLHAKCY